MLQILKQHENGTWTITLDPVISRKKISMTQETLSLKGTSSSNVADIFNPSSWSSASDVLDKLINTHEINVVVPQRISTMKVVLGDGGDSVPSCITWSDKKDPTKTRTMTENNYSKILSHAPDLINASWEDLQDGKFVEEIAFVMEGLKKISVDREKLKLNLKRNCTLVILSEKTIPYQIVNSFKSTHNEVPDLIPVTSRDALLNGSEWWTSDASKYVPKSYDLFGE
jgi:hypothetical protein